jgi:hypothetical protein
VSRVFVADDCAQVSTSYALVSKTRRSEILRSPEWEMLIPKPSKLSSGWVWEIEPRTLQFRPSKTLSPSRNPGGRRDSQVPYIGPGVLD